MLSINNLIEFGQNCGSEWVSIVLLIMLYSLILLLWRLYGKHGLYLYNIIAIVVANIQVLKVTPFFLSPEPVALGTLMFATTFLASDILTEHCGVAAARLGIKLSFASQVIVTAVMLLTLAYPSSPSDGVTGLSSDNLVTGLGTDGRMLDPIQASLYVIFVPSLRILIASLVAYYISQLADVWIFQTIKRLTEGKKLWLRLNVATMLSGLLDNVLFSTLAWVVLSPTPVSMHSLIFTYILGTYAARIVVSVTSTPVIYLSGKFMPQAVTRHNN